MGQQAYSLLVAAWKAGVAPDMPVAGCGVIAFADWCSACIAAVCDGLTIHLCHFEVVGGVGKVVFELSGQSVNFACSARCCDSKTDHSFSSFGRYEAEGMKLRTRRYPVRFKMV